MPQPSLYQIRADYDRDTLVIYQAFSPRIANAAVAAQAFVPPFSRRRMTWIKPSFLWLMARTQWGLKSNESILAVRITREGWEQALSEAVLTSPEKGVYPSAREWEARFAKARVHVQWDPERSLRGAKCHHRSIQVGISRHLIDTYADEWVVGIEDLTSQVRKIHKLCKTGRHNQARRLLPPEREYPVTDEIAQGLGMHL